jgi:hypothetical protein
MQKIFSKKNTPFTLGIVAALVSYLSFIALKKRRNTIISSNIQDIVYRLRNSGLPIRFLFIPRKTTPSTENYYE